MAPSPRHHFAAFGRHPEGDRPSAQLDAAHAADKTGRSADPLESSSGGHVRRDCAEESVCVQVEGRVVAGRCGGHVFVVVQPEESVLAVPLRHDAMPLTQTDRLEGSEDDQSVAQIEAELHVPGNDGQGDKIRVRVFPLLGVDEEAVRQKSLELNFHRKLVVRFHLFQFDKGLAVEGGRLGRIQLLICK